MVEIDLLEYVEADSILTEVAKNSDVQKSYISYMLQGNDMSFEDYVEWLPVRNVEVGTLEIVTNKLKNAGIIDANVSYDNYHLRIGVGYIIEGNISKYIKKGISKFIRWYLNKFVKSVANVIEIYVEKVDNDIFTLYKLNRLVENRVKSVEFMLLSVDSFITNVKTLFKVCDRLSSISESELKDLYMEYAKQSVLSSGVLLEYIKNDLAKYTNRVNIKVLVNNDNNMKAFADLYRSIYKMVTKKT